MDTKDATEDVIDTSDAEEMELLEAQKPGYHQRVWGSTKRAGSLGMMDMEVDSHAEGDRRSSFAQLQPRTPSHNRVLVAFNWDPFRTLSRLHISPRPQTRDPPTTSPDIGPTSNSDSGSRVTPFASDTSTPCSSPLGALQVGRHKARGKMSRDEPLTGEVDMDADLSASQDPISLLTPLAPNKRIVQSVLTDLYATRGTNNVQDMTTSPTRSASSTLNATPILTQDGIGIKSESFLRNSSPPLEFPKSPGPDPLSSPVRFPLNGASRGSVPLQTPNGARAATSKPAVTHTYGRTHNGDKDHGPDTSPSCDADPPLDAETCSTHNGPVHDEPANDARNTPQHSPSLDFPPNPSPDPVLSSRLFNPARPYSHKDPEQDPFRSMSPLTPPPPTQPLSRRISPTPPSPAPTPPSPPIIIPPDPEPPGRAYSLRHRSAMQLNPFAYEKKMYKRQLRGMPEAIVKDPTAAGRDGRRERYREERGSGGEAEDWEDRDGDGGDGDEDEEWRRREEGRERQRERERRKEVADAKMRELGLVLPSSDEEDEVLKEVGEENNVEGQNVEKRGKKRKRSVKVRKFPMTAGPEQSETTLIVEPEPRPRLRPRPVFRGPSPTPDPSAPASAFAPPGSEPAGPIDFDSGFDFDSGADDAGVPGADNWPGDLGTGIEAVESERSSPIFVDDAEADDAGSRMRRLRCGRSDGDDSDEQMLYDVEDLNNNSGGEDRNSNSESSNSVEEVEMTEKDRKRLKALRRMMPAAHARKLLVDEQEKARQKTKERARRQEESEEEEAPLQPGRGRKRFVSPGSKDPKRYEIKGDTETETESDADADATDREVIVVDDDGSQEDAERALEESDDGVDDEDIQIWLGPEDLEDESSAAFTHAPRADFERDRPRGGDLIDRMLQRTKRVGPRDSRPAKKHKSKPRGSRNPALDIVTKEARRHGAGGGRQTKLAFPEAGGRQATAPDKRRRTSPSAGPAGRTRKLSTGHQDHRVEARPDEERKKSKKQKRGPVQTHLYIVPTDGRKVISGRGRQIIHIDDDDAFHEALAPTGNHAPPRARTHAKDKANDRSKHVRNVFDKLRPDAGVPPDAFDVDTNGGQRHSQVTLDFDIHLLPSGMTFGPESYMGKGRLYDLISVLKGNVEALRPTSVTVFEQRIDPDMPIVQVSPIIAAACDKLYDSSTLSLDDPEAPVAAKAAEATMHSLCQMVSFRALPTDDQKDSLLAAAVLEQTEHLIRRINERIELISADGHSLDYRTFALYWFAVELHVRLSYSPHKRNENVKSATRMTTHDAERYIVLLLRRLLEYGLDRTLQPLQNQDGPLDVTSPNVRTLELWACALHLAPLFQNPASGSLAPPPSFWRLVEASMEAQSNKPDSQLDASERIWRTLFSLCAVSQFSVHGLTTSTVRLEPYWPMVSKALCCIRLSADEQLDNSKPAATLQKRDAYLRLVTSRCFLLCVRWNWRLNDADSVFRDLCAIFRSRKFSNLLGEPSDFPTFIRDQDEPLLHVYKRSDTAFGLFLKLIVRAAKDFPDADDTRRIRSAKLGRLLSLAVPVGSTSFTKASPPIGQDLSMLYNRYSAVIIAIYVDSTPSNIRTRLQQIRRYITFKDADCNSRAASIRAMMNVAILLRHLNQPLDDVLSWATEMTNDLIDSYDVVSATPGQQQLPNGFSNTERDQIVLSLQLLLGSIRLITETPTMNRSEIRPLKYPDLGLLQGAWINRVCLSSVANDHRTGLEVRKCVQSFLAARRSVISLPPLPKPPVDQQESQESQDEYGDGGLDLNDPAVLALLAGFGGPPDENCVADQRASETMNTISPWIYRLLIKHFSSVAFDRRQPSSSCYEGDQWIECWLGCASVVVRNKKRDWTWFFDLGREAIRAIRDSFWRGRMRLRFMLTILQLDPAAYYSHGDQFFEVWFQSIVSPEITIENDFTARLLSVDHLRHPLFENFPCAANPNTGIFTFDVFEFEQLRSSLINATLYNVAKGLKNADTATQTTRYIPFLETMISTLQESFESMNQDEPRRPKYAEFCKGVITEVRTHRTLMQEPSLRAALNWGNFA